MITNADITIFHEGYDPATRLKAWTSSYFPSVSCQRDIKTSVLDNGLKSANVIKIRIPTKEDLKIENGDKLCFGRADVLPDAAHTVIGFADNRKGSPAVWHWKVVCA